MSELRLPSKKVERVRSRSETRNETHPPVMWWQPYQYNHVHGKNVSFQCCLIRSVPRSICFHNERKIPKAAPRIVPHEYIPWLHMCRRELITGFCRWPLEKGKQSSWTLLCVPVELLSAHVSAPSNWFVIIGCEACHDWFGECSKNHLESSENDLTKSSWAVCKVIHVYQVFLTMCWVSLLSLEQGLHQPYHNPDSLMKLSVNLVSGVSLFSFWKTPGNQTVSFHYFSKSTRREL